MQRLKSIFYLIVVASILVGCGPIYKKEYAYVPPASSMGKMCMTQCVQNKSHCEQMCQVRVESCRSQARQDAFYDFQNYKRERRDQGKEIKKSLSDFDRSYTCNTQCNCNTQFNTCYSACGGQVLERQTCVAFCDKQ